MLLAAVILATGIASVPMPTFVHPDWGPEPPVAPFSQKPLPHEAIKIPMIFPVIGAAHWHNDFGAKRKGFLHTGIDIPAPKMSLIVAPISGVLGLKDESFWIYSPTGFAILGTHLNNDDIGTHDRAGGRDVMFAPGLRAGQSVEAGQFIGYVGMSGDATGPHLHFELYVPGSGSTLDRIRNPYLSLRSAQHISRPRAYPQFSHLNLKNGQTCVQGFFRKANPGKGTVTFIVLYRAVPGHVALVTHPTWLTLHTGKAECEATGETKPVTVVFDNKSHIIQSVRT